MASLINITIKREAGSGRSIYIDIIIRTFYTIFENVWKCDVLGSTGKAAILVEGVPTKITWLFDFT